MGKPSSLAPHEIMLMISLYIANVNILLHPVVMDIILAGRGPDLIAMTSELQACMDGALVKMIGEATMTAAQLEEELNRHFQEQLIDSADKTAFELMDEANRDGINTSLAPLEAQSDAQAELWSAAQSVYGRLGDYVLGDYSLHFGEEEVLRLQLDPPQRGSKQIINFVAEGQDVVVMKQVASMNPDTRMPVVTRPPFTPFESQLVGVALTRLDETNKILRGLWNI